MKTQGLFIAVFAALALTSSANTCSSDDPGKCRGDDNTLLQSRLNVDEQPADEQSAEDGSQEVDGQLSEDEQEGELELTDEQLEQEFELYQDQEPTDEEVQAAKLEFEEENADEANVEDESQEVYDQQETEEFADDAADEADSEDESQDDQPQEPEVEALTEELADDAADDAADEDDSEWLSEYSKEDAKYLRAFRFKPLLPRGKHEKKGKKGGEEYLIGRKVKEVCKPCDKRCQTKFAKAAFLICDRDKNGHITVNEARACLFNGDAIDKAKKKRKDVKVSSLFMSTRTARRFVYAHEGKGKGKRDGRLTWKEYLTSRQSGEKKCTEDEEDSLLQKDGRKLLSSRTSRADGTVVSVTKTTGNCITDMAKNVWKTVTSSCSRSVNVKDCWKSWEFWKGSFWSCRWKTVTETFTCLVNKLVKVVTQVVAGFKDCWKSVVDWFKAKVGGPIMDFMKSCSSLSSCLDTLLAGPKWLWDKIVELVKKGVNAVLNSGPLGDGIRYVGNLIKKIPPTVKEVAGVAGDIGNAVVKLVANSIEAIKKQGDLNMCTTSGYGLWYFKPTDCGAFGRMKDIFKLSSITSIPSIFADVCKRFGQCLIKLGMLSLPSPFLDVKVKSWCVPQALQIPIKGLVGTFRFVIQQIAAGIAGCTGTHKEQPVCVMAKDMEKAGERLKRAFSGAFMQETAEVVGETVHGDSSVYTGDKTMAKCAGADFEVFIKLAGAIAFPPWGDSIGINFAFGLGCRNKVLFADLTFGLAGSLFIAGVDVKLPTKAKLGASVTVGFSIGTKGTDIVTWAGSFDLAAAVLVGGIVIKVGIGFKVLPKPDYPKGFTVSPKFETALLQEEVARQQEIDDAVEKGETTEERVYIAAGTLLKQFTELDYEGMITSGAILSAMEEGAARMSGKADSLGLPPIAPKEAALSAGLAINFCLTCKISGGQSAATANPPAAPLATAGQTLVNHGVSGCTSGTQCVQCEGDCDSDSDCATGHKCFQRNGREAIPGCTAGGGGDLSGYDYCYKETGLKNWGGDGYRRRYSMLACQGDCDSDGDCAKGMKCFQRDQASQDVPGCAPGGSGDLPNYDYCYQPTTLVNHGVNGKASMATCEGDCDRDSDCATGLKCFQRNAGELVPGCTAGGGGDANGYDYCYNAGQYLQNRGGTGCTSGRPCGQCAGDCDRDSDCGPGMKCYQRDHGEAVPGCTPGGMGDLPDYDYCYTP